MVGGKERSAVSTPTPSALPAPAWGPPFKACKCVCLLAAGAETLDVPAGNCVRRAVTSLQLLSTRVPEAAPPSCPSSQLPHPARGGSSPFSLYVKELHRSLNRLEWGGLS